MSGYVIANIDVKNPEAYKEYVGKVVPGQFKNLEENTLYVLGSIKL